MYWIIRRARCRKSTEEMTSHVAKNKQKLGGGRDETIKKRHTEMGITSVLDG